MQFCSPVKPRRAVNGSIEKRKMPVLMSVKKTNNKSVDLAKRRRKVSLQVVTRFQISPDHLGFLIEEQKTAELATIKNSVCLSHYYESLLSLFLISYNSAQIITSNLFECRKQTTGLSGLKFVGILFSLYERNLNEKNIERLKIMAKNILKMGKTQKLFEEKVQFVCRKIAMNFNMRKRIEMAFLNHRLESFWHKLIERLKFSEEVEMLEDMYELAPEKLAYWDFTFFVNQYLVQEQFCDTLREQNRHARKQPIGGDTLAHNFTYQFLIIEIFCFHEDFENQMERQNANWGQCRLI